MIRYPINNIARIKRCGVLCFWVLALLCPKVGFGSETSSVLDEQLVRQKVPVQVLQELAAGRYQDLIVEFEHQDIRGQAVDRRLARRLRFHDDRIVAFKAGRYRDRKRRIFDAIQQTELSIIKDYKHLPLAFVRIKSKRAADRLGRLPEVKALHVNQKFYPHLAQSLPFINQSDMCACDYGGGNTVVAVLDTGLDYKREAFGSCSNPGDPGCKVVATYEAAEEDGMLDDAPLYHGTNVAGIVLGVAPDSRIAAVDVFDGDTASLTDIIDGINWVIAQKTDHALNMVAVNLSLGARANLPGICTSSSLRTAIQDARSDGILTIASSGNDGWTDEISYPACIPEVTSVGAVYDGNIGSVYYPDCADITTAPDQVTCFSNSSNDLNLLAPGAQILAAGITLFGTSQAAPHVSGAAAVLRSAFPGDSLDETQSRLLNTGVPVTDPRNAIVTPRLSFQDICSAADQDNDCTADSVDNCPSDANPNQEDADGDGIGDACDDCPNDPLNDLDGDTICGDNDPDDDGDGMPDVWENSYAGLNPLANDGAGDLDGDGYTNFQEYTSGTSPADDTSLPMEIRETIPHDMAGVDPDQTRVASDASFAVRLFSTAGIDITDHTSIEFSINDGSAGGHNPYARDLGDGAVVRIVNLGSEPDSEVKNLWAIYDRSNEATYGNYAYETDVNIKIDIKDKNNVSMPRAIFDFQIESETQHDQAQFYQPDSGPVDPGDPALTGPYNNGIQVNGGDLEGARILFNSSEPVPPRFGPVNELPPLLAADEEIVGIPMNLQPPTVFNTPVKIFVPCPGYTDVSRILLYLYNGTSWVPALDENGNVLAGGIDFIKPNSRVNHNNGAPSTIEIQVYHFSGIQAASSGGAAVISSPPQAASSGGGGGGGCFIDTLR
jgi:hypothetical protein